MEKWSVMNRWWFYMFKLLTVLSVHVFMICVLPLACMVARRYVWPRCLWPHWWPAHRTHRLGTVSLTVLVLGVVVVVEEHDNWTSSSSSVLVVGGITSLIRFPSHTVPAASSDSWTCFPTSSTPTWLSGGFTQLCITNNQQTLPLGFLPEPEDVKFLHPFHTLQGSTRAPSQKKNSFVGIQSLPLWRVGRSYSWSSSWGTRA